MDLSKIITITGKSGLFNVLAQSKNAIIVESMIDKKKFPVHASSRFNTLDEIYIFTTEEEVLLKDVLLKIFDKENGGKCPVVLTDSTAIKAYFAEILPNYDTERVYESDMKKLFIWYSILHDQGLINKEEKPAIDETKPATAEEVKDAKTAKATKAIKTDAKGSAKKPAQAKMKNERATTNAPKAQPKNLPKKAG